MHATLRTAGEVVGIDSEVPWVDGLIEEATAGALDDTQPPEAWTVRLRIERKRAAFDLDGARPLARDAWVRGAEVIVRDACTSGFDLRLRVIDGDPEFTYRWRPPVATRGANYALRARFHLLARAVLLQYPALWWAGTRGRAPIHSSVCTAGDATPLLAGASGSGKSTLIAGELAAGEQATSDNVCVGDGVCTWGLVEPLRIEGRTGRRMPHGRREVSIDRRVDRLQPDCLLVLRRSDVNQPVVRPCEPEVAARELVTGTYIAGELRRYWGFAATLAAGTGVGPAHPSISDVAGEFAARLPCLEVFPGHHSGIRLAELLDAKEHIRCA